MPTPLRLVVVGIDHPHGFAWRETLRAQAFGRYEDILFAAVTHPAMLVYLDNSNSTARSTLNSPPESVFISACRASSTVKPISTMRKTALSAELTAASFAGGAVVSDHDENDSTAAAAWS